MATSIALTGPVAVVKYRFAIVADPPIAPLLKDCL